MFNTHFLIPYFYFYFNNGILSFYLVTTGNPLAKDISMWQIKISNQLENAVKNIHDIIFIDILRNVYRFLIAHVSADS